MGVSEAWQGLLRWLGLASEPTQLDRARQFLNDGNVEEAIFVARDVLYTTLVGLGRAARIGMPPGDQDERAFALNDSLVQMGVYAEPMYKQIQQWLQLGQYALAGQTEEILLGSVQEYVDNLDGFTRIVAATLTAAGYTNSAASGPPLPSSSVPPPPPRVDTSPVLPRRQNAQNPAQPQMPPTPKPRELTGPGIPFYPDSEATPAVVGTMPRIPGFVGRGHVVMRLAGLLRQNRNVALVPLENGIAGMGLSAVASETLWLLEQDNPPAFAGGILALHCFGRHGEDALRWIYNEISLTWRVPAIAQASSLTAQEREVRRLFTGRPALLVLDHVEMGLPIQRLMDTLAATGACVLITSRFVPRADQLSVLRLEPLGQAPATNLMQDRFNQANTFHAVEWDEDAARTIAQILEYRPLALELAMAAVGTVPMPMAGLGQRLTMARMRGLLGDHTDANQALRFLLDLLNQSMDRTAQNRFTALAIFAGPTWSEDATLAIFNSIEAPTTESYGSWDASLAPAPESASDTLRDLIRRQLVQSIPSANSGIRYRLNPFVRGIISQALLDRPVVMEWAGQAMASHYAGVAVTRRRQIDQTAMQEEYVHLEAGLIWAHAHNEPELVVSYGMGLYRYWQRNGLWREGQQYLGRAIRAAQTINDRPREATLAQELATIELSLGHRTRCREWYDHSLEIWRALGNRRNEAVLLFDLGRFYQDEDDLNNAQVYYDASLQASRESGDEQGQARALQAMGLIFESMNRPDEARQCYEQVFAMRQQAHDAVGQAGALNVLGVLEYKQRHFPAAKDLLTASLNNALDVHNDFWEAEARFWLGETAVALGNPREALAHWQRALVLYIRLGRASDVQETQRRLSAIMPPRA